jgi:hypothetical protein
MSVYTIKTLTLTLDADATPPGTSVECQLTTAQLVDNPTTEDLTTFCGTESSSIPNYELTLAGFQDYGQATAVCDLIHTAYVADPVAEIACVLTVGGKTRTFDAKPIADVPFGGDAGAALTFTTTLDVVGDITDGTVP